jgi:hypothetical protein
MLVVCPQCQKNLRVNRVRSVETRLTLRCPACAARFHARLDDQSDLTILLAHEDSAIGQQIFLQLQSLPIGLQVCRNSPQVFRGLRAGKNTLLLLDVAFAGTFPFELIETVKCSADAERHKVVLLPSIYSKTAYKKKPTSLYGADAYLELHHIGDRLLPLLAELFPSWQRPLNGRTQAAASCGERDLRQPQLHSQAAELAQLLVADITLYHQDRLQQGIAAGNLQQLFACELAEGRRLLRQRLPRAAELKQDPILDAFQRVCEHYRAKAAESGA